MGKLLENIKKIDRLDFKYLFMLIVGLLPAFIIKLRKKNIWLMCERYNLAEDNGWILYQWIRKNHPEQPVYFILGKKGKADKEAQFGRDDHIIVWATLKHFIYYLAANTLIKTMFVPPRPCQRVCDYYERFTGRHPVVYLRHGIGINGVEHHHYKVQRVRLYICGAKPEYDFICSNAGYPEGYVQYTGLARFDDLLKHQRDYRFVLILPTWRRYVVSVEKTKQENENCFLNSSFFSHFHSLLTNKDLIDFIENAGYRIKFCLHAEFQCFRHLMKDIDPRIEMVDNSVTIHELLMSTSLLITDYSSVLFDVGYMKKPMIFYQFDSEEFKTKHISEGYFSYKRDGMGPVVETEEELFEALKGFYDGEKFVNSDYYLQRCERFFPTHDNHNCERIYNAIKAIND